VFVDQVSDHDASMLSISDGKKLGTLCIVQSRKKRSCPGRHRSERGRFEAVPKPRLPGEFVIRRERREMCFESCASGRLPRNWGWRGAQMHHIARELQKVEVIKWQFLFGL
jgi:hypothetical protein